MRFRLIPALASCLLLISSSISASDSSSKTIPLRPYKSHELPVNLQKIPGCTEPFQEVYDKLGLHRISELRFRHSIFDNLIVIAIANYRSKECIQANKTDNSCALALRISLRKSDNNFTDLFGQQCFVIKDIHTPVSNTFEKKDKDNPNLYYFGLEVKLLKSGKLTPYVIVFVYEKTEKTITSPDVFYLVQADDWREIFDKDNNYMAMNPYFRDGEKH